MTPEEILKNKNIYYRYSGGDLLVHCLNPEHDDKNPSMRIDKLSGKYHCFSCGYAGNIYKYFNIHKNLSDIKVLNLKEKIRKILNTSIHIPINAEYYKGSHRGISFETLEKFKAFTLPGDKEFDGRLIFPITNIHGEVVCFIARYLFSDLEPKYLVKPQDVSPPLFPSTPDIIEGSIILVEGIFDMLNLYDKGLRNTVCTFGVSLTSKNDRNNFKLKNRFATFKLQGVSKVYILFDGDNAGRNGAKKLFDALNDSYIVEILELPEDKDPGSMTEAEVKKLKESLYEKSSFN